MPNLFATLVECQSTTRRVGRPGPQSAVLASAVIFACILFLIQTREAGEGVLQARHDWTRSGTEPDGPIEVCSRASTKKWRLNLLTRATCSAVLFMLQQTIAPLCAEIVPMKHKASFPF